MQAFDKRILTTFNTKTIKLNKMATITKNSCHLICFLVLFILIFAMRRKLFVLATEQIRVFQWLF